MKGKSESEVAQSCLTLSDPMDCSLPGSSIHGIFQAGVLEWGAIALLRRLFYFCVKVPEDWLLCPANDMGRRTLKTRRGSVPSGALAQTLMGSTGTCFHSSTYSKQNWVRVQSLEAYQTLLESTSLTWWGCQSQFFSSVRLNISLPRWASRYRKSGTSSMGIVGQSFSSQAFSTKLTAWLLPTQLQ